MPINNPMELVTQAGKRREKERAGDLFVISLIKYTCGLTVCSLSIHCNYRRWTRMKGEMEREREREKRGKKEEEKTRQPPQANDRQAITRF